MRFSLAESMVDPQQYPTLARAAEAAGFTTMLVPDSIGFPERYAQVRSGSGHDREFLEDKPFIDPFALIGFLAAVTERLRFATYVLKLPIRHPVLVAKQATSLAVLCGERLSLGVGTSPWPEDYEVCGVPWERRGQRFEEAIEIIRGLGSGDYFSYAGEAYTVPALELCPVPEAPVPILVGGYGPRMLRRAARLADGCMFARHPPDRLAALVGEVRRHLADAGRPEAGFEVHAAATDQLDLDELEHLGRVGVTDLAVQIRDLHHHGPDPQPLAEKLERIAAFGERVIAPLGG